MALLCTASSMMSSFYNRRSNSMSLLHCRYEYRYRWWCVLILAAYIVFFRVTSILLLKYKSFLRR